MHDRYITPKDMLSRVLWMQYKYNFSTKVAIQELTKIRKPKYWLMAGNPMTQDVCIEKCRRWASRFHVSYEVMDNNTRLRVKMSLVSFMYDWNTKEAALIIDEEAAKAIGWNESVFTLKGKHCCDLEKIFTINEKLETAIELPKIIDWCIDNGIYDRKKRDFKMLADQLYWWSNIVQCYAQHELKIVSTSRLLKHLPVDDCASVKSYVEHRQYELFRFNTSDSLALDRFFADKFLPELRSRLGIAEQALEYITSDNPTIHSYPQDNQPWNLTLYRGYGRNVIKTEMSGVVLDVYNQLYDMALHLDGAEGLYRSHLGYFQMDVPMKSEPNVRLYLTVCNKYLLHDRTDRLCCYPEELPGKFPKLLNLYKKHARECIKEVIDHINHIIWLIENRISVNEARQTCL